MKIKRTSVLICLLVASSILAVGQNRKKKNVEMQFEKSEHQFGTLKYASDGSCVFKFKNNSKKPIAIANVKSSCGCTAPTWSREPIQPGQYGSISVVYNTNIPGAFNKTIQVFSTAQNSPVRLSVRGTVTAKEKFVNGESVSRTGNGNNKGKSLKAMDDMGGGKNTFPVTKGKTKGKRIDPKELEARMRKKK